MRLKAIKEKRRKYERKPFDGTDDDEAYLIALRHGDLSASNPWTTTVRVSTSTTHRTMSELFHRLFGRYGHVYQHPRYKKDTQSYEWNLSVLLDRSFDFLLAPRQMGYQQASQKDSTKLAYIAGILDAEGSINIGRDKANTSIMVTFYNTDVLLLSFVQNCCRALGYAALGPYLDKRKDTTSSKYDIVRRKDYYKVAIARFDECQSILPRLPIRHPETRQEEPSAQPKLQGAMGQRRR
jgi:hypothetical protein